MFSAAPRLGMARFPFALNRRNTSLPSILRGRLDKPPVVSVLPPYTTFWSC